MKRIKTWFVHRRKALLQLFILLAVFGTSVGVRYKHFGLPINRHHEWLTAHSLIIMKIWEKGGAANYHFAPVYTFPGKGNKFDFSICALDDDKGDVYYVSYGPFSTILPYVVFKALGFPVNANSLVGFNLVIHFLTALFLYLLVLRLAGKRFGDFSIAAISVFVFYVFSPGTLWFHANVYFSEVLAQLFLSAGMYVFYLLMEQRAQKTSTVIWYGVICFFGIYNEWLGLFFTFITGLYFLFKVFKDRVFLKPFLVAVSTGILSLGLIVFQYSSIAGFDKLKQVLTHKFVERSGGTLVDGYNAEEKYAFGNEASFKMVEKHLNDNFVNLINTLAFVIPLFVVLVCWRKKYFFSRMQGLLLGLLVLMVVMHHYVFFNFTSIHDFSMLKTGFLLTFLIGIMLVQLERFSTIRMWLRLCFSIAVVAFVTVKAVESYHRYNKTHDPKTIYHVYKIAGEQIRNNAKHGQEVVFTNTFVSPDLVVYAECNVRFSLSPQAAIDMARINKINTAFFRVRGDSVVSLTRYTPQGDSVQVELQ